MGRTRKISDPVLLPRGGLISVEMVHQSWENGGSGAQGQKESLAAGKPS